MADEPTKAEMAEPQKDGEMPAAETVNNDKYAAELEELRAALKKANGEAAKYRHKASEFEKLQEEKRQAEMSEMEKLQEQLQAAQRELQATRLNDMRQRVAKSVGLPEGLAARLQGEDEESLTADAEALLETLPKPQKQPPEIRATNPGGNGQQPGPTPAQRRKALYGQQVDLFDAKWSAEHGGGVIYQGE